MMVEKTKVVFDTNIFISFLLSDKLNWLSKVFSNSNFKNLISEKLIDEITNTCNKPKLKKKIAEQDFLDLISTLRAISNNVFTSSKIELCRDPKDNFLLELAKDGIADYLITGDKDLLELKHNLDFQIIKLTDFKAIALNY